MNIRASLLHGVLALVLLAACDDGNGSGADAGDAGSRIDASTTDAGTGDVDSGPGDDGGTGDAGPTDDGGTGTDAATDSGLPACAGMECTDYAAALSAAPRGATSLDNCVIQLHQTDCCGANRAYGVNHAARDTLCPAEDACVATYPTTPGCTDATITTDTGETTTNMDDVRVRIVDGTPCSFDPSVTCYTCETFVCTTGPCRSEPGIAGGCG